MLAASKAALAQDMTQLQGQIGELQQRLEGVDRKFRRIEQDATNIEGEVSDLVRTQLLSHTAICIQPGPAVQVLALLVLSCMHAHRSAVQHAHICSSTPLSRSQMRPLLHVHVGMSEWHARHSNMRAVHIKHDLECPHSAS